MNYILVLLLLCFSGAAHALDYSQFERIPVQHEGRIKPLESFARINLKLFSGSESLKDKKAIVWFAETLFNPSEAITTPIFKIQNPEVIAILQLPKQDRALYSYLDLSKGLHKTAGSLPALLKKDRKDLTPDQKALLNLHERILIYTQLLRSFSLILPLDVDLPKAEQKRFTPEQIENGLTFLDLFKADQRLRDRVKKIMAQKGEDIAAFNPDEQKVTTLSYELQMVAQGGANNTYLRILPPVWDTEDQSWYAPWDLLLSGAGAPQHSEAMALWRGMAKAWRAQDNQAWLDTTTKAAGTSSSVLKLEIYYNKIHPFLISTILYGIAFFAMLFAAIFSRPALEKPAALAVMAALALQITGIIARVLISGRPPVGTLYESILFVGAVAVAIALALAGKKMNTAHVTMAATAGLFLGLLGMSFASDGDSIQMLSAVLNTNFWLATHVLCITAGYGWCVVASIQAHMILLSKALQKAVDATSLRALDLTAIAALLFTTTGTILGGIWADQSWGRFWGWDPKENGALLIVLWLAWILHAKISRHLSEDLIVAAYACLNIMVGLAWIGVNLLGVGLHSYGFIDGVFTGLTIFVLTEIIFIGACLWRIKEKAA